MKIIDFKISSYFPDPILWVAGFFDIVAIFILVVKPVIGIVTLIICILVLTTQYRMRIDFVNKSYEEYLRICWLKFQSAKKDFTALEYLYVTKSNVKYTMSSRASSSAFRKEMFNAYLKFSDAESVHLFSKENRNGLTESLAEIAKKLNLEIHEST